MFSNIQWAKKVQDILIPMAKTKFNSFSEIADLFWIQSYDYYFLENYFELNCKMT